MTEPPAGSAAPVITAEIFDPARHLEGLRALFEASSCPCYCRYWHFEGDKNEWLERCSILHGENERELVREAEKQSDEARGVVALADGAVVGWAKVAPARGLGKLYAQRYYRGLRALSGERPGVFAVGCMLISPSHRRKGAALALARAAVEAARAWGASRLEAFPRVITAPVSDEELWMGTAEAFEAAGFQPFAGEAPYPVLAHHLGR